MVLMPPTQAHGIWSLTGRKRVRSSTVVLVTATRTRYASTKSTMTVCAPLHARHGVGLAARLLVVTAAFQKNTPHRKQEHYRDRPRDDAEDDHALVSNTESRSRSSSSMTAQATDTA